MGSSWRRGMVAMMCVLGLLCTGCSTDKTKTIDPKSLSTSSETPLPSTPSLTADQQAIISQYKAYFTAITKLVGVSYVNTMNELTKYSYPKVAKLAADNLQGIASDGQAIGGEIKFGSLIPQVEGDSATVAECRDESGESIIDAKTGATLFLGTAATGIAATFHHDTDGNWRIVVITSDPSQC